MTSTQNAPPPGERDSKTGAPAPTAPSRSVFVVPDELSAHLQESNRLVAAELGLAENRELKSAWQHELAEYDERMRGDEVAAARGYLAAFNARPAFRPPLDALIRLYTRRRSTSNLAKLYDALVKAATAGGDRAEALVLRGELLEDRLSDAAGARVAYDSAIAADATYRPAWLALERMALRSGDSALLARALTSLIELTEDPSRKSALLVELAWEKARPETPAALDEASRLLREAAAHVVGRWRALTELERFGERHDRPQDVVFALEGRASLAQQVARGEGYEGGTGAFSIQRLDGEATARSYSADLWSRAAWLRLVAANDPDGARGAIAQALALLPDDPRYRFLAMTLADQAGDIAQASAQASWLLGQGFGDPSMRASLHFRVAESAALDGDLAAAATSLQAALALDPTSAAVRGALIEQLVATGDGLQVVQEFDRLAEAAEAGAQRATLRRASAVYALALRRDLEGAIQRFKLACEDDAADVISRRALVTLLARREASDLVRADEALRQETVRARVTAIEALLPHASDEDERAALLLERFFAERHELRDHRAAAVTAEQLVEATGEAPWAMESAAFLWAAAGSMGFAARWAEALAGRGEGDAVTAEQRAWKAAAARWAWAAGDEARAREIAVRAHRESPEDSYLAALALRLAVASKDAALALQVATLRADASLDPAVSVRWLLVTATLLGAIGAEDAERKAIESAIERAPGSPTVRAAALASTKWRSDAAFRARLVEAALEAEEMTPEETALGLELALVRAFVDHDLRAATDLIERVALREPSATVVVFLQALSRGATDGPDSETTVAALQAVLSTLPSDDPLWVGMELEVARALAASASTRDQAVAARELVNGDRPQLVAPRLLAMLDAIQRETRQDVPVALRKVADHAEEGVSDALLSLAVTSLRGLGRGDARALAAQNPDLMASVIALAETLPTLERAAEHADAVARRGMVAPPSQKTSYDRAVASWSSLARLDEDALASAEAALEVDPNDLVALDVQRSAGRRLGRWSAVAAACAALAKQVHSPARAATFWEEAGVVAADALGDTRRAETYLRAAIDAVPDREVAYKKLREILEGRKDTAALERLVSRRVEAVARDAERAELYWEQARLRRALGHREGALESATRVVALDPNHVAALALLAEIHAAEGRIAELAEALAALAACKEAPAKQRKVARAGAIDLFDLRLGLPERAIEQLDAMVAEGEADDAAIERGLSIATQAGLWDAALRFARRAADRANGGAPRVAALLRVIGILRDSLADTRGALEQARKAHEEFPTDLEVLHTLQGLCDSQDKGRYARRTIEALRDLVRADGASVERVQGVVEAARSGGDHALERAAQRLAVVLGARGHATTLEVPSTGSLRDSAMLLRYRNAADSGRAVALLETVLPDLTELCGLTTDAVKVGRSERVRGAHPARAAVTPLLKLVGVEEFELYVGGSEPARVAVLPDDPIAVVLGSGVAIPLDASSRFELVRKLLLALRGAAPLGHETPEAITARALAALAYAEVPIAGGTQRFEALIKPVGKALSRRVRKAIAESGRALGGSAEAWDEILKAARAMASTARRGALAASGAVAAAARDVVRTESLRDPSMTELFARNAVGRDLALYCVSDVLVQIERDIGADRGG